MSCMTEWGNSNSEKGKDQMITINKNITYYIYSGAVYNKFLKASMFIHSHKTVLKHNPRIPPCMKQVSPMQ